jgi:predicted TIM-barrel fold metal-dependent hydrolase
LSSGSTSTGTDAETALLEAWAREPAIDHHCHPLIRWPRDLTARELRAVFTEAVDPQILDHHMPAVVAYHDAIRRLAAELGCAPTEEAVLAARNKIDPATYANRLLERTGTGMMLLDTGYTGGGPFSLEDHARDVHVPQLEVVRLETLAEPLIEAAPTAAAWLAAVRSALRAAVRGGAAGVKSIAAYRAGLRLRLVDPSQLKVAYAELYERARSGGSLRISGETLCHSLLFEGAEECAQLNVPLQFHCGYGDNDEDLALSSPLGLRPLLVDPRYDGLRVVLLHCYPYHREAAYLCSVYRDVYMDLSLTLPLAGLDGKRAMRETLGLCPWTKLLYASDASRLPEIYFVGAALHREALAGAFGEFVDQGILTHDQAVAAGVEVLSGNARQVYRIEAQA